MSAEYREKSSAGPNRAPLGGREKIVNKKFLIKTPHTLVFRLERCAQKKRNALTQTIAVID